MGHAQDNTEAAGPALSGVGVDEGVAWRGEQVALAPSADHIFLGVSTCLPSPRQLSTHCRELLGLCPCPAGRRVARLTLGCLHAPAGPGCIPALAQAGCADPSAVAPTPEVPVCLQQ